MMRMQSDMDRIFSRLGTGERRGGNGEGMAWMPRIDVKAKGDDIVVRAELPGIDPQAVDIEVTDGVLVLRGERKAEEEREDEGWLIRESYYGRFERSMVLPEGVTAEEIRADYRDGVLEIHVPKALEAAKPKTTKISIGGGEATPAIGSGEQSGQQQGSQQEGSQQEGSKQTSERRQEVSVGGR
ncbi:MAG: Hsp20/alpha crystallin family protein [Actinobacteria bacterium HGW-Actinobacteria-9]|nr:MAG: Hsp20/alpha crystallin family protein [Actinobacteria bacterium HGW-Actinobacteria-9]